MTAFKFVISEPATKKSFQKEVDQAKAISLVNKKIGDEFTGDIIDLQGYTLQITGGTDKDGFPMHPSLKGPGRKRVLLNSPPGFHPKLRGQTKRKTVRGDSLSTDIAQINVKVIKKGEKSLEELVPMKPKEKKEEKPAEKKLEEKQSLKEPEKKGQQPEVKKEAAEKPGEQPAEKKQEPAKIETPEKTEQPKETKEEAKA